MDYFDSDNDGLELLLNSPPPKGGEDDEEESVDIDGEVLNVGTSDVNDNRHLPNTSAEELSSDDNGVVVRETDAHAEEVTDASEDSEMMIGGEFIYKCVKSGILK